MSHDNKIRAIRSWIECRKVLDIGCVDHSCSIEQTSDWMHRRLVNIADIVVGIDVLQEDVQRLKEKGFDIRLGDAQSFSLGEDFDVVFAGEVIEHLADFSGFFRSVKNHLRPHGVLIITTPNVFSLWHYYNALLGLPTANPEHVCWFDCQTLRTLVERHGLFVVSLNLVRNATWTEVRSAACNHDFKQFFWTAISYAIETLLPPRVGRKSIVMVCRVEDVHEVAL